MIIIKFMKNLHQSLIDYDLRLLEAIAACRGVPLTTLSKNEVVAALVESLLSPTETAIMLDSLSQAETEALHRLLAKNGQIEEPRFTRQYGVIRSMGAARLNREKPWQNPANPAEGLWYKGFIFKTFQLTPQGNVEIIYLPTDLLAILRTLLDTEEQAAAPADFAEPEETGPAIAPQPTYVRSGQGRLRESMFSLLAYLQTHPIRLQNKDQLSREDKTALAGCLPPPFIATFNPGAELDFLLHLGRRADLLTTKYGRLRPEREATRAWLQATDIEQERLLRDTWRADPTWNDLWHVPGLVPQATGWENSPLLARSKILAHLAQASAQVAADAWLSLADFVTGIKRLDPDFQRPNGDYDSWYIYDEEGRSLMGFEHWDQVEGGLIRYLLTHILPLLGVLDLGLSTEDSAPVSFKITPSGQLFLTGQAPPPTERRTLFLRVNNNFRIEVPRRASLYDRFQLTRFAELERREENRTIYQVTQASVGRALRNGVSADQIVAFLARASNNRTPLKMVETLRVWGRRQGTAHLERATLLRLEADYLVEEIRQHPLLRPLLGEVIGPTTILVPEENVREVRRLLNQLGYLGDGEATQC